MRKYLVLIFCCSLLTNLFSQIAWEKRWGVFSQNDEFRAIEATPDGGWVCVGQTLSPTWGNSIILSIVKFDSLGNEEWNNDKPGGWAGSYWGYGDIGYDVALTDDGGYMVVGEVDTDNVSGKGAPDNAYVVKFDSMGFVEWDTTYTDTLHSEAWSIEKLNLGDFIISGTKEDTLGNYRPYLFKIDPNGNLIWENIYVTSATHIKMVTIFNDTILYGGIFSKVDLNGIFQYSNGTYNGYIFSNSEDGELVLAGSNFVIYDSNENNVINKSFPNLGASGRQVKKTPDGGYAWIGHINDMSLDYTVLMRFDQSGDTLWTRKYPLQGYGQTFDFICMPDGGFVICGRIKEDTEPNFDYILLRTDCMGNIVSNPVQSNFTISNDSCSGQEISFTSLSSGGNTPLTYNWDFDLPDGQAGNGVNDSTPNPSIAYDSGGTYNVTLTTTEYCGYSHDTTLNHKINTSPVAHIQGDTSVCDGDSSIVMTSMADSIIFWLNNIISQSGTDTSYSFIPADNDLLKIQSISNGCSSIDSIVISVAGIPNASLNGDSILCEGNQASFIGPFGADNYNFVVNQISIQNSSSNSFNYIPANNDLIKLIVTNTGCSNMDSLVIAVNTIPTIALNGDSTACDGDSIVFTANSGLVNYEFFVNNNSFQNSSVNNYEFVPNDGDQLLVVGTDNNGCEGMDSIIITMYPLPFPQVYQDVNMLSTDVFSSYSWVLDMDTVATSQEFEATQDGQYIVNVTNEYGCINISQPYSFVYTGIGDSENNQITIYPNPASQIINIQISHYNLPTQVSIVDALGQEVYHSSLKSNELEIDISRWGKGVYYLLVGNTKKFGSKRIVIE